MIRLAAEKEKERKALEARTKRLAEEAEAKHKIAHEKAKAEEIAKQLEK